MGQWVIPSDNHEGKIMMGFLIFFLIIDFFLVILRIIARVFQGVKFLSLSDWFLIAGFLFNIGLVVIVWACFSHGYGLDISKYTLADAQMASALFVAIDIIWNGSTTFVRISMLLFYRQICAPAKAFGRTCLAMVLLNGVNFIVIILTTCLICAPISYIYVREGSGRCGDLRAFETYTAVSAMILDAATVAVPMPQLWKLQMHASHKIGISSVLGLGLLICALTIIRLIASYVYLPDNITKQSALVVFITGLEPAIGIFIAGLTFVPYMWKRAGGSKALSSLTGGKTASASHPTSGSKGQYLKQTFSRSDDSEAAILRGDAMGVGFTPSYGDDTPRTYIGASGSGESWLRTSNNANRGPGSIYVMKDFTVRVEEGNGRSRQKT